MADRVDNGVGQAAKVMFNLHNLETRAITDARVATVLKPSDFQR